MIYVMRVGTSVKIGFTQNQLTLKTRLKSIQATCPHRVVIEATMKGSKLKERCMHGFNVKKHLHGEWFIMTKGEVLEMIEKYKDWNPTMNGISKHPCIQHVKR